MRDHFETFRTEAADLRDAEELSSFVEQELLDFLHCGALGGGLPGLGVQVVGSTGFYRSPATAGVSVRVAVGAAHLVDVPPTEGTHNQIFADNRT